MGEMFHVTRVVSRNFFHDMLCGILNFFGFRLKHYEDMIDKAIIDLKDDIKDKNVRWCRIEIAQLTNGAMTLILYGELK